MFIHRSKADCFKTFRRLVCEWQFNADYSASGRGSVGGVFQINLRVVGVGRRCISDYSASGSGSVGGVSLINLRVVGGR